MRRPDPALALLVALLAAQCAVVLTHYRGPVMNDEAYWLAKARYLTEHHRFPPIDANALAAQDGRGWGNSDWRPQLYTIVVAAVSGGDLQDAEGSLRLRMTILQFALLAAVLIALYLTARPALPPRARLLAAALLGIAPWTFEYVNDISSDPPNAFMATLGILLLWRAEGARRWFVAMLVLSLTILLRPEMIVIPPLLALVAMLLRRRIVLREALAAVAAFIIVIAAQVAYRTSFTGRLGLFGGLHITNKGAFDWTKTWLGTEKEAYDFVYAISEGRPEHSLPARAFANDDERRRVDAIIDRVAARHQYRAEDDVAFEQLARERRERAPVRTLLLRLWNVVHVWVNVENPQPLLQTLASVPRAVRRPILGGLFVLRIAVLVMAAAGMLHARTSSALGRLTLLMATFTVARTLLIGVALNWKVHRYVLAAWPAMLWCGVALLVSVRGTRSTRPRGERAAMTAAAPAA